MLQNYLKCSFRALLKSPLFTALNVGGLAIGLTVSLLLFLHVQHERGFDLYHSKSERIHRVNLQLTMDDSAPVALANAPIGVGPAAKEGIAAVEQYARLLKHGFGKPAFIIAGENKLVEESLYWTDSSLLALFDLRALAGDLGTAFSQPNTVALSRSAAIRYFGTSNPVGRSVQVDHMQPLEVRAVYEDFPDNSTLDAAMIGSLASVDMSYKNYPWSNASFETWLLLGPDANPKQVQEQLGVVLDKNVPKQGQYFTMSLQPLKDVHLQSSHLRSVYSSRLGDRSQVNLLGILGMAILLIACFNYMNLATARSQMRYREVGINKTMGASRKQLAYRFYIETALLVGISLALALVFLQLSLPAFNQFRDCRGCHTFCGLLSGIHPLRFFTKKPVANNIPQRHVCGLDAPHAGDRPVCRIRRAHYRNGGAVPSDAVYPTKKPGFSARAGAGREYYSGRKRYPVGGFDAKLPQPEQCGRRLSGPNFPGWATERTQPAPQRGG